MRLKPHFPSMMLPIGALLLAMVLVQSGASLAKGMFPEIGAEGATALRLFFGAATLLAVFRPWRVLPATAAWHSTLVYGVALGGMNLLFYMSLRTVPLGITVSLEFTGPLSVAVLSSRRALDFLWIGLAVTGLALLSTEHARAPLDPAGACFALRAGLCWALYIVFGQRAGSAHGVNITAWGMTIAAILVIPFGVVYAGLALFSSSILFTAVAVGLLSSAFPFTLEMIAMTRLPARVFSTLMSIDPALAAISGRLFLNEKLSLIQYLAIAAIMAASIGATATLKLTARPPLPPD